MDGGRLFLRFDVQILSNSVCDVLLGYFFLGYGDVMATVRISYFSGQIAQCSVNQSLINP